MITHKQQLLAALIDRGWEQLEIDAEGVDWWADEHWRLRSTREGWGREVVLTFLVDPMWDGPRKKGQGVWAVAATVQMPNDRIAAEHGIRLCTMKRRLDKKLRDLLDALDEYRRGASSA